MKPPSLTLAFDEPPKPRTSNLRTTKLPKAELPEDPGSKQYHNQT